MNQSLLDVFQRIIKSKKSVIALIALAGDAGLVWGMDVPVAELTEGVGAVWNGFGALLVAGQTLLDIKWGSASDGSGES